MFKKIILPVIGILTLFFMTACDNVNDKNRLSVYICDAPAPNLEEMTFYISQVEVRETGTGNWLALAPENRRVSLLTLVNGRMQQVAMSEIEKGKSFDAVRLTLNPENASVTVAGNKVDAQLDPADTELIIPITPTVMDGPNRPILIDIDAAASLIEIPGTPGTPTPGDGDDDDEEEEVILSDYRIKPVARFVDTALTGAVRGGLQTASGTIPSQALIQFTNTANGEIFSTYCTTATASRGAFFIRLLAGEYQMDVLPSDASGLEAYNTTVTVGEQQAVDLSWIVLENKPTEETEE